MSNKDRLTCTGVVLGVFGIVLAAAVALGVQPGIGAQLAGAVLAVADVVFLLLATGSLWME